MHRLGVCSWSLRPTNPQDLAALVRRCGLSDVQLALDPIRACSSGGTWPERETAAALADCGITILSGMMGTKGEDYSTLDSIRDTGGVRSDENWSANLAAAEANADIAARLGIRLVTFHAGFLPHDHRDPLRSSMIDRLRRITDLFASRGLSVALETGQESAATLLGVLHELQRPSCGINFDPANMILYAMGDPVESLAALAPFVRQVHIKDATPSPVRGQWGTETPAGQGSVNWTGFFRALRALPSQVDLLIEREAGTTRVEDILAAAALVQLHHAPNL